MSDSDRTADTVSTGGPDVVTGGRGALAAVGLEPAEELAYELLVGRPSATAAELAGFWPRPESLPRTLANLEAANLATRLPGEPNRYTAAPPDLAIEALLLVRERQMQVARQHVGELDAVYRGAAAPRRPTLVETITGHRAVEQRLLTLHGAARREVRCLVRPSGVDAVGTLPSQVAGRTVYQHDCLARPGLMDQVTRHAVDGAQARSLPTVPVGLCLVDDRLALLAVESASGEIDSAVLVYPSALLGALGKLFEALWERAAPLTHPTGTGEEGRAVDGASEVPDVDPGEAGHDQQQLVALLLSGSTDEAIARQLGLGYRTLGRRIAALMTDLGARNRFQAGVQAAFRDFQEHRDRPGRT